MVLHLLDSGAQNVRSVDAVLKHRQVNGIAQSESHKYCLLDFMSTTIPLY